MKKNKPSLKLIIAVIVLIVAIIMIIVFAMKASKSADKNKVEDNVLNFELYSDNILISELEIDYKDKKVNDVILYMVFEDESIAKEIASIYKQEGEYSDVTLSGNKVVMHYNEKDISEISNLSKKELIERFQQQGYIYQK